MNEAYVVREIKAKFKKLLPHAVVLKINDMTTTGIPDLTITYAGQTHWVEVKYLKEGATASTLKKNIKALQLATCRLLARQGRCQYLIAFQSELKVLSASLITPDAVAQLLEHETDDVVDNLILRSTFTSFFDVVASRLVAQIRGVV